MHRARLAPAMISTSGHRGPRRRQRGALPAWLPSLAVVGQSGEVGGATQGRSSSPAETCPGPTTSEPTAPDQLGEGAAFRLVLPWPSLVSIPTWHLLLGYRRRALDKPFARVSSV